MKTALPTPKKKTDTDTQRRLPLILHPYLFAIFPAISLLADHVRFIFLNTTIIALAILTLVVALLLLWAFKAIGLENHKAGIVVSCLLFLFFSYGHVFYLIANTFPGLDFRHRHLLPIWGLLFLLLLYFAKVVNRDLSPFTVFLNTMGAILIVLSVGQIAGYKLMMRNVWEPVKTFTPTASVNGSKPMPDIYYIILDSYANAMTLSDEYGFENDEFITYLQAKGFFVAEKSASNYAMTRLSLASSLNMDYLDNLSPFLDAGDRGFEVPRQMIENNTVMWFLKSQGYTFIFLGSGDGITQANRYADQDIRCGFVDETVGRVIQSTLIWPLADAFHLTENDDRTKRLCAFETLAEMPGVAGPKFVFAHIVSPHMPFLFDAEGNPIQVYNPDRAHIKQHYVNQLIFISKKVEELVDEILSTSEVDPVIIIQADTGPLYGYDPVAASQNPTADIFQQSMRILNVYHLPNIDSTLLYDGISPVNTFRLIFNLYFGADFPLLDDQSYFSTVDRPYQFINATEYMDDP